MDAPEGLAAAAEELYGLEPDAFIARREGLVREARAAKDRPLAAAIGKLRRPTIGAWYLNLAARSHLVALMELLKLGEGLREAQASLDTARMRDLGRERGQLERRVLADLTAHLATRGITPTPGALEEVRSTLRAALADPSAAAEVKSGRLSKPLSYAGFGEVDMSAALAAMAGRTTDVDPPGEPDAPTEDEPEADDGPADPDDSAGEDDELRAAEAALAAARAAHALASARRELKQAAREIDERTEALAAAEAAEADASDRATRLADELARAERELAEAREVTAAAASALDEAREREAAAQRTVEELG